jgi:hypothetical protein
MHARHYHPEFGRFLQPDPSAMEANLYGYTENSPVTKVDPSGEICIIPVAGWLACAAVVVRLVVGAVQITARIAPLVAPLVMRFQPMVRAAPLLPAVPRVREQLLYLARHPATENVIRQLFKANARIGNGSSMDMYRWERLNGLFSNARHFQKLIEYRVHIVRLIRDPRIPESDKVILRALLNDIQRALNLR